MSDDFKNNPFNKKSIMKNVEGKDIALEVQKQKLNPALPKLWEKFLPQPDSDSMSGQESKGPPPGAAGAAGAAGAEDAAAAESAERGDATEADAALLGR